jgi:intracellular sulfur oxidation DsrE/DsrF family protein
MNALCQTPSSPLIPQADGYAFIPTAAVQPSKTHIYKVAWDGTKSAKSPGQLLPVLNNAGSELNAFAVSKIPISHAKFIIAFHGDAVNGILKNDIYKQKFGVDNPNIEVLKEMKKAGVKLFVCGQYLLGEKIDFKNITEEVSIASDALIVLMTYQNLGYAIMSF